MKPRYTTRTRDAYRIALASVTGLSTIAALGGIGFLTGKAAADSADQQAAKAEAQRRLEARWWRTHPQDPTIKTTWKKRKYVTKFDGGSSTYTSVGGGHVSHSGGGGGGGGNPKPPSGPSSGS
jgi:hypothetical protein